MKEMQRDCKDRISKMRARLHLAFSLLKVLDRVCIGIMFTLLQMDLPSESTAHSLDTADSAPVN